jgi:hypothetical protein
MIRTKVSCVVVLSLLVLCSCLIAGVGYATAETVSVPAGKSVERNVDLNAEDEVSGRITVVGDDQSKDINFTVLDPQGSIALPTEKVTVSDFKFTASGKGTYSLVFDNSQSLVDKTVSLNYDVRHYWFGMPQEFVLMLIVVFLGVLGLVLYALMSKG